MAGFVKNMKSNYILALDQGTTSSRAILFNHECEIISSAYEEFTQFYPEPGWVEHDPNEIWESQLVAARKAIRLAGIDGNDINAIGIANQRETVVVWDKESGMPVYKAIVWQCRRSTSICEELIESGVDEEIHARTGLRLDPYFSGTKLCWLFREIPGLKALAENGEILFGTIDTWLLWKLTGQHFTDITNASRTLLFNIHEQKWDETLLTILGIPEQILPTVLACSDDFGQTKTELFGKSIPVYGVAGDQQAALFGQTCILPGMVKNTYGTGCFALLNTGSKPILSKHNLLTTIAWRLGNEVTYALEGSVFIGGAVVQWLRDELQILASSAESEKIAASVPNTNGVYFVPAFVGLGAPYWDPEVRGSILGLTRGVKKEHIIRAALESIALQSEDLFAAMRADYEGMISVIKTDGGATDNRFLMQFQSDISGIPVLVPENRETTAFGAALFAGLFCGFWQSIEEIEKKWKIKKAYYPEMSNADRDKHLSLWHKAISSTREFE
jgi:glycerol kinase